MLIDIFDDSYTHIGIGGRADGAAFTEAAQLPGVRQVRLWLL